MSFKNKNIAYLNNHEIEEKSIDFINEYYMNTDIKAPIDVFNMVEYLGYDLDFNKEGIFYNSDILGATYNNEKIVQINEKIVNQEGRMNFTIAHEIGHILLHSDYENNVFCRKNEGQFGIKKNQLEVQADKFAAFLMMPSALINNTFYECYNKAQILSKRTLMEIFFPKSKKYKANIIAKRIMETGDFNNVSKMAMINRLIGMGLIKGIQFQKNRD